MRELVRRRVRRDEAHAELVRLQGARVQRREVLRALEGRLHRAVIREAQAAMEQAELNRKIQEIYRIAFDIIELEADELT